MRRRLGITLAIGIGLLAAPIVFAQTAGTTAQAKGQSGADATVQPGQAAATSTTNATADASAQADVKQLKERIEKRAARTSAQSRTKAETQLATTIQQVNEKSATDGETVVATRLASEFGVTPEALTTERTTLGTSWGQLMLAHTLAVNSSAGVTVEQLIALNKDGMGWGQIAAGLGLHLGSVVSSINSENRVAQGLEKADGRVVAMRGEGARVGTNAALNAGVGTQAGKTGVNAGAGLGVKINH
jgi:hypothetical protein